MTRIKLKQLHLVTATQSDDRGFLLHGKCASVQFFNTSANRKILGECAIRSAVLNRRLNDHRQVQ